MEQVLGQNFFISWFTGFFFFHIKGRGDENK